MKLRETGEVRKIRGGYHGRMERGRRGFPAEYGEAVL